MAVVGNKLNSMRKSSSPLFLVFLPVVTFVILLFKYFARNAASSRLVKNVSRERRVCEGPCRQRVARYH
jgi:hypothetical protein